MFIRKTTEEDFSKFIPAYHDVLEAEAMGITPSFPDASECVSLDHDGYPLAIGGNVEGQCWFVTSNKVWELDNKHKREFRRLIIQYRDKMLEQYDTLWNYVYIGNFPHIRFLKSIGAVFQNVYSEDGKFRLFTIRRHNETL